MWYGRPPTNNFVQVVSFCWLPTEDGVVGDTMPEPGVTDASAVLATRSAKPSNKWNKTNFASVWLIFQHNTLPSVKISKLIPINRLFSSNFWSLNARRSRNMTYWLYQLVLSIKCKCDFNVETRNGPFNATNKSRFLNYYWHSFHFTWYNAVIWCTNNNISS